MKDGMRARAGLVVLATAFVGLSLGLTLGACGGSESSSTPPRVASGGQSKGAALFKLRCAICHGDTGHGDGLGSQGLPAKPRNLTSERYKFVDIAGSASEVEALTKYIATGRLESGMPAYRDLVPGATEEQVQADLRTLAEFVASIRPEPNFVEAAPPAAETPGGAPAPTPEEKPAETGG